MIPQPILAPIDLSGVAEAELVALAKARDEAAIRELIRRVNPRLFRVARGLVDSDAEAEDVLQDAYLAGFTHLDAFRGEARFTTWMTRIVFNAAGTRRRGARLHEEYDTVAEDRSESPHVVTFPAPPQGAEAALGRSQVRSLIEEAIGTLPPDLRLVFLLREAEGLSIRTIASDLALNPVTVKTRLFRARRRLRARMEQRLKGGFDTVFPFDGARCARMADRVVHLLRREERHDF
jgi:RNA polymerase sigma-70 factor, ECF subfamily